MTAAFDLDVFRRCCADPSVIVLVGALVWAAVASVLVTVSDVRRRVIPNRVMVPALIAVPALLILAVVLSDRPLVDARTTPLMHGGPLLAGLLGGVVFAVVHLVLAVAGGLGGGDVKLALLLGILLGCVGGWEAVGWGGVLAWACAGFVVLVRRVARAPNLGAGIPFAPCLVVGSWTVIVTVLVTMISAVFPATHEPARSAAHLMEDVRSGIAARDQVTSLEE